ncbi:hypothetical protein BDFB_012374 [Asbolus verrucosus]|uniref:Uncharacterized protein n=1 Tax=Asbolus verrucosus TaxID=1661398 RepID=A0A482VTC7_ASBVE|nr:hypothetical protein BDFB_012374 [Asbolus verrucosus]
MISKQTKLSAFATADTSKTVLDKEIKKGEIHLAGDCAELNLSFFLIKAMLQSAMTQKLPRDCIQEDIRLQQ